MLRLFKIICLALVIVATEALPTNQSPTKTGKLQHLSEYYSSDHLDARPAAPSRPTPINPDIVSEPKPEEKIHLIPPKEEEKSHRQRRTVDETEAQDQPTTEKVTRAWWRRMNFARTTEEPQNAPEDTPVKESEEKKEEKAPEEDCESEEQSKEIKKITQHSVNIQRIQTQSLPVIRPHREEVEKEKEE